ncbi:MAG TPA: hypothetical protein VGP36_10540 [Mycobacteriales bacterium]|jgi:hypothetical protein|nr:hypothetical protein [Mycobacteriales bacterium]
MEQRTPVLDGDGLLAPLVQELRRIAVFAESREIDHLDTIRRLEDEVSRLRETVAHLRMSTSPVPAHLRVVVARAMCAAEADGHRSP